MDDVWAPASTYRLQLSNHLTFEATRELVDYLHRLGIDWLYLSPVCRAVSGSTHGYDIINPEQFDPALGSDADFARLAEAVGSRQMGIMVDVVPNHMGIDDVHNVWWRDVLTHGRCSPFAHFFDIDWSPPKEPMHGKVLLATLGEQFGDVLENQQLKVELEEDQFVIRYYQRTFPTDPRSWPHLLQRLRLACLARGAAGGTSKAEGAIPLIDQLIQSLAELPESKQYSEENASLRQRVTPQARERLKQLVADDEVRELLGGVLAEFNGTAGAPASFNALEEFLAEQPYRLCYWRVATDEINYRRFFDVDTLAAIRVEDPEVFEAVHAMVLRVVHQGQIHGLRIDHSDGLRDPQSYLASLAEAARLPANRPAYLVIEKILGADEALPPDWPIQGTTGYDQMNVLTRTMIDHEGMRRLRDIYHRFIDSRPLFTDVLYEAKRTILASSLSSEIYVLSQQLSRIAEQHRRFRDFTRPALHRALREVVACFPVYRTYVRPQDAEVSKEDREHILEALRMAKRRNGSTNPSFFDFIGSVLLLEEIAGDAPEVRQLRREFVLKFQQITGPVMAKGMEDTAFYRYYPLASLNEVGGSPVGAPLWIEQFHNGMIERQQLWPRSMSATATHDTKRGEDVRARLNVLTEVASEWEAAINRWREMNDPLRVTVDDQMVPDANEEYLIYQTLVGTWPVKPVYDGPPGQEYQNRIAAYLQKALREAKLHTSWLNPQLDYEQAIQTFLDRILHVNHQTFVENLDAFARSIADAGFVNSLAQVVLKLGAPGIPDFYQGTEFWDFSLVDPDNRRPVDFARRQQRLAELEEVGQEGWADVTRELLPHWPDERLKLLVTTVGLRLRRDRPEIFAGPYTPLAAQGDRADRLCAFVRGEAAAQVMFVTPRFVCEALREFPPIVAWDGGGAHVLMGGAAATGSSASAAGWPASQWWRGTELELPDGTAPQWRHLFTGERLTARTDAAGKRLLSAEELLRSFPVGILVADV